MLRHDRGAHPYRCNHFTLTRHRSVARAAQSLGRPARTHAWPRIRPEEPYVVERGDGSLLIDGMMPAHDAFQRLGLRTGLSDGDFHTIAGFALFQFGHLPEVGE